VLLVGNRYLVIALPSKTEVCYFTIRTKRQRLRWEALMRKSGVLIVGAPLARAAGSKT
jgi:hypothetical protein